MADASEKVRIEIGFDGGQIVAALVSVDAAERFQTSLAREGERIFELEAEDGTYVIAINRILYVKLLSREGPVGFAGA